MAHIVIISLLWSEEERVPELKGMVNAWSAIPVTLSTQPVSHLRGKRRLSTDAMRLGKHVQFQPKMPVYI